MRAMSAMVAVPNGDDHHMRTKLPECQIIIRIRYGAMVDGKPRSRLQARSLMLMLTLQLM